MEGTFASMTLRQCDASNLIRQMVSLLFFRCVVCGCYLSSCHYEQDSVLYCEDDYWNKYGQHCADCGGIITGPIIVSQLASDKKLFVGGACHYFYSIFLRVYRSASLFSLLFL